MASKASAKKSLAIETLVKAHCRALGLNQEPDLEIIRGTLPGTLKAVACFEIDKRPLIKAIRPKPDADSQVQFMLAVAHEMRHVWQYEHLNEWGEAIARHKEREELGTAEAYNMQPDEIDANAYAALFMEYMFGIELKFPFSEKALLAIEERMEKIEDEKIGFSLADS